MIVTNLHQSTTATLHHVSEKKVAKPSTYKERVWADRIVMAMMLLGTIIFAILSA